MASKALKGKDASTLVWHTPEGIDIKPVYTADDTLGHEKELPGKLELQDLQQEEYIILLFLSVMELHMWHIEMRQILVRLAL